MPTVQVSTWDQFVAAFVSGTSGDRQVIEIMADLDAKSSITGSIGGSDTRYITVNGNYHNIANISTATTFADHIFRARPILWSKCNFVNMIRNEPYAFFYQASASDDIRFEDCTFQGQGICICGYGRITSGNYPGFGNFTRCFIAWTQTGTTIPGTCFGAANFDRTYIDCELPSGAGPTSDFGNLQNTSYLKGRISGTPTGHTLLHSCSNSVINIECASDYTITSYPGQMSVYNKDKLTGTIATTTNVIGVSDAQLKDAAYLASIGFNIIV